MEKLEQRGSLVEAVSEKIISFILENEYSAGMRIPSEPELSGMLGVGRNTVREAIRSLVVRNVLEIRRGNGTFISAKEGVMADPLGLAFIKDRHRMIEDMMQIRYVLEPHISSLAAQNATQEEISALEEIYLQIKNTVQQGGSPHNEDIAFHSQIARCSKNVVMQRLVAIINDSIRAFAEATNDRYPRFSIEGHKDLLDAIRFHKPADAYDAMVLHLAYSRYILRRAGREGRLKRF